MKITDIEKAELLATKEGLESNHERNLPHIKQLNRFLMSRVGYLFDDVVAEFTQLKWVPVQYRRYHDLAHMVETHTFMKDGEVWFFENFSCGDCGEKRITDALIDSFYVHPQNKRLHFVRAKKGIDWEKRHEQERAKTLRILGDYHQLIKMGGIWYEVKGKPTPASVIEIDGLHYTKVHCLPTNLMEAPGRPFKLVDGVIYVACTAPKHRMWTKPIGPKDRMIDPYTNGYPQFDTGSVRITMQRQLNHHDLKKFGLSNDAPAKFLAKKKCKVCGGFDCRLRNHIS